MELKGKCVAVLNVEHGVSKSGNSWQKQQFVVDTGGQYPKKACFQLFGDKAPECPAVGDEVTVSFNIDSREYNGRWYTSLQAWKIEKSVAGDMGGAAPAAMPSCAPPPPPGDADGLPF